MRVVHLSTFDVNGGAARATYRLHNGLNRLGHDSSIFVAHRSSSDPTVLPFSPSKHPLNRMRRHIRRKYIKRDFDPYLNSQFKRLEIFSDDRTEFGPDLIDQIPSCDVVNLHWITWFVDYSNFFKTFSKEIPVVWTLHDMNAFTGGCHYDFGCGKHSQYCHACPQLESNDKNDLSNKIWHRKYDALNKRGEKYLHVVTNSYWLENEARKSALFCHYPVTTIHYGLDTEIFAPRDRQFARSVLGISQDAKVVLIAAHSLNNHRKGFSLLTEALKEIDTLPDLFLLSFGDGTPSLPMKVPHLDLGKVNNDRFLSLIYSAADIFVIPSLQEAFGQTALEAIACGTPVVGFKVGGISDMVRSGVNGWLVPPADISALRHAIVQSLSDKVQRAAMSINCRKIAEQEFSLDAQARRYEELYDRILADLRDRRHGSI